MTQTQQKAGRLTGYIITLTGAILFSTKAIIVKQAFRTDPVDPLTLLSIRMLFSLPFYVIAAFWISRQGENRKLTGRQWGYVLVLGLLGYYCSSLFDFIGLQYISAGLERLILFLYPTFVILINRIFFRQKIGKLQKIALLLTYIGITIAYAGELGIESGNTGFFLGSLLIFCCAITYAIYITGSGKIIPVIGAGKFTAYAMLAATAGIFTHFMLRGNFNAVHLTGNVWIYGLLLAIIATVIPSFLLSFGIKKIGSNNVAIVSGIGPVATIVQAHYVLGEPIFTAQVIGTILVIGGVLLIGKKTGESG